MAVIAITKSNFEQEVLAEKLPVVLDFSEEGNPLCREQEDVLEELSKGFDGKVKFGRVDVNAEAALAFQYQVMTLPLLVVMEYGIFKGRTAGFCDREQLLKLLESCVEQKDCLKQ